MAFTFNKLLWVPDKPPYVNATNLNRMEDGIQEALELAEGGPRPVVTELPLEPFDGQEVFFQSAQMKAVGWDPWHLRYTPDSPLAQKWDVISAGELYSTYTNYTNTVANSWQFGLPIVQCTIPLAGMYEIMIGFSFLAMGGQLTEVYFCFGADSTLYGQSLRVYREANANSQSTIMEQCRRTAAVLPKNTSVTLGFYSSVSTSLARFDVPWFTLRPRRLSA